MRTQRHLYILLSIAACFFLSYPSWALQVEIKTTKEGGYQLVVDNEPLWVKGVIYQPIPPGNDYSYNFWLDLEVVEKDAILMQEAGFNAVRFYAPSEDLEQAKKVIRALYKKGIYTIMGHWVGFWNYPFPFYCDEKFQQEVKKDILAMVSALKDEEGILMWILGNENNFSFSGKVNPWSCPEVDEIEDPSQKVTRKAEIYYSFINDIAKEIKTIDKNHPVALGNGELITLDVAKRACPDIDVLALIFYRGKRFGNIFNSVRRTFDKPVLISEMGCDAYDAYRKRENQDIQAEFLRSQLLDIYKNTSFAKKDGNCLGGAVFEWSDEWWKHNPSDCSRWIYHDTLSNWSNGAYYFDIKAPRNLNMNEEWFGIIAYEKDDEGNFLKKPRKAYYALKEFFSEPAKFLENK